MCLCASFYVFLLSREPLGVPSPPPRQWGWAWPVPALRVPPSPAQEVPPDCQVQLHRGHQDTGKPNHPVLRNQSFIWSAPALGFWNSCCDCFSCSVSCWSGAKFKKRCVITLILLKHVKLKLCMLSVNVCSTWTSLSLFLWKLKPEPTKKICSDSRLLVQIWIFSHFLAFCVLLRTTVYRIPYPVRYRYLFFVSY